MSTPNCKCFHAVTHVIFDLDGTLMDSEKIYNKVWRLFTESYEKVFPNDFDSKYRGLPMKETIDALKNAVGIDSTYEEMQEKFLSIEEEVFKSSPMELMSGAEKLIKHFNKHQIPIAIGTNSSRRQVDLKIKQHEELFKMMHHIVTNDDVAQGKPAPDIYVLAAQKFPARPKYCSCLVFEDSNNGLMAAKSAGMQCVFIPEIEDVNDQATITLKSLDDFEPELFGLPSIGKRNVGKYIGQ